MCWVSLVIHAGEAEEDVCVGSVSSYMPARLRRMCVFGGGGGEDTSHRRATQTSQPTHDLQPTHTRPTQHTTVYSPE